jgi:hypothetical protein
MSTPSKVQALKALTKHTEVSENTSGEKNIQGTESNLSTTTNNTYNLNVNGPNLSNYLSDYR